MGSILICSACGHTVRLGPGASAPSWFRCVHCRAFAAPIVGDEQAPTPPTASKGSRRPTGAATTNADRTFPVVCPQCLASKMMPPAVASKRVTCRKCGCSFTAQATTFRAATPAAVSAAPAWSPQPTATAPDAPASVPEIVAGDTPRTRPRRRRRLIEWSAVLILAGFGAGAATLLYLAFRPGSTWTLDPAQEAVRRYAEDGSNGGNYRWVRWWPSRRLKPADARRWDADTVVQATYDIDFGIFGRRRDTVIYLLKDGRVIRGWPLSMRLDEATLNYYRNSPDTANPVEMPDLADAYFPPDS
jgi:hypothetical protein